MIIVLIEGETNCVFMLNINQAIFSIYDFYLVFKNLILKKNNIL